MSRRRRAVITGGARGIGFGIAMAMLEKGYEVMVTGFSDDEVAAVPERDHLSASRLDVTQADSITGLVAQVSELDVLVNCAGIIYRDGAEYDINTFQRVIDVNLTGTMRMCTVCRPKLAASRGTIVNTASMLSFFGGPLVPRHHATHKVFSGRVGIRGNPGQRNCSRLDCDRPHAKPCLGQGTFRANPRAYTAEAMGRSG